jgi:hypothetical protein
MSLEAKRRGWARAYENRYREEKRALEQGRVEGLNRLSDQEIERRALARAERIVNEAINRHNEEIDRAVFRRRVRDEAAEANDIEELPAVMSKSDLNDSKIFEDWADF